MRGNDAVEQASRLSLKSKQPRFQKQRLLPCASPMGEHNL